MQPKKFETTTFEQAENIPQREVVEGLEIMLERLIYMPDISEAKRKQVSLIRGYSDSMARLGLEEDTLDGFDAAQNNFFVQLRNLVNDDEFWKAFTVISSDIDSKEVAETFLSDVDGFLGPAITAEERERLVKDAEQTVNGTDVEDFRKNLRALVEKLGTIILVNQDSSESERVN